MRSHKGRRWGSTVKTGRAALRRPWKHTEKVIYKRVPVQQDTANDLSGFLGPASPPEEGS